jgi:signal transduction histidine kinase
MASKDSPLRLEYLLDATRNLRNALDLEAYLQLVAEAAAELTDSEASSMMVADESSQSLHFVAAPPIQWNVMKSLDVPLEGSIAGRVFTTGNSEIVFAARREQKHFKNIDSMTGFETHSMAAVPIIFKGEKIGVFEVINHRGNADYTEEDVAILEILAAEAAVLLYNDRLEKQVLKAHAEIAQLDRMKSDFTAIASHELRTPLGLILGHATFLREMVDAQFVDQVDTIIRAASKLKEIIEDLSKVDNFQTGMATLRNRMFSVNRLILELIDSYQEEARSKKIAIRTNLHQTSDLVIDGDVEKISIAVSNLIKNAVMFTNEGGHVFVQVEQVPGYVKLSVIDDGIGIPAANLTRIFERFYQVESHLTRKHGGMGLGLSVSKVMVEMHGGRIWAESEEGKGSTFTILLPLNLAQVKAAQKVMNS